MPLTILLPMVVLGILSVALILHLKGFTDSLQFADETEVRSHFHRLLPFAEITAVLRSEDGKAAIVSTPDTSYLLWSFGADCTLHSLFGARFVDTPTGLRVQFNDFACPSAKITLTAAEKPQWISQQKKAIA